uniref:Uncharacterized protein n=1 Tax=Zea mays TaxID=4577 RepID=B6U315_MAIZE|nr:hypothetical protein [Zea mays]
MCSPGIGEGVSARQAPHAGSRLVTGAEGGGSRRRGTLQRNLLVSFLGATSKA